MKQKLNELTVTEKEFRLEKLKEKIKHLKNILGRDISKNRKWRNYYEYKELIEWEKRRSKFFNWD